MDLLIVFALVGFAVLALAYRLLRKAGIGRPGGKPDCGCGSCATKRRKAL